MSGLPAGITLKSPSAYGGNQLRSIIEAKDRLTLTSMFLICIKSVARFVHVLICISTILSSHLQL